MQPPSHEMHDCSYSVDVDLRCVCCSVQCSPTNGSIFTWISAASTSDFRTNECKMMHRAQRDVFLAAARATVNDLLGNAQMPPCGHIPSATAISCWWRRSRAARSRPCRSNTSCRSASSSCSGCRGAKCVGNDYFSTRWAGGAHQSTPPFKHACATAAILQ